MRRYLWLVAVVIASAIVAAGVTFAVARLTEKPVESALERSYRAGVDALSRSDYSHALQQFESVAAQDPNYLSVQSLLAKARAGLGSSAATASAASTAPPAGSEGASISPSPTPDSSSPATPAVPAFTRPADLAMLLPPSVSGFGAPRVDNSPDAVSATYLPTGKGVVTQLTVNIRDRKTPEAAQAFVDATVKPIYSVAGQATALPGGVQAYFGTTSRRYASIAWVRGTLAYQVMVRVSDSRPEAQMTFVTGIARQTT
jgi:hypothetical protein